MNNLIASLGLDGVEADPNALPDGKYDGDVFKSEYVLSETKNSVSHVITYRVTEGQYKGAQRQQWYQLGDQVKDTSGNFPSSVNEIASYNPTMSDAQKQWYKKLWVDLGINEMQINQTTPAHLVGKPVTFGVKKNGAYININFVELRGGVTAQAVNASAPQGEVAPVTQGADPFSF